MQVLKNIASTALFLKRLIWVHEKNWIAKVVIVTITMVAIIVLNVSVPLFLREIINRISVKESGAAVTMMLIGYGLVWSFSHLSSQLRSYFVGNLLEEIMSRFNLALFDHLHCLSLRFHLERRSGAVSHSIMRASQGIESLFWGLLLFMIPTIFEIALAIGVIMYLYGMFFGAIMAGLLIAYGIVSTYGLERTQKSQEAHNEKRSATQAFMLDSLLNFETVKYFSNQQKEHEVCKQVTEEQMVAAQHANNQMLKTQALQSLVVGIGLACMTLVAGKGVIAGNLNASDFVLINSYILQFIMPLSYFGYVLQQVRKGFIDVKDAVTLLEIQAEVVDAPSAIDLTGPSVAIIFDHVSFHYDTKREILHDISFTAESGKTIAIVGPTGSGKSTIARLLFRLYDVEKGSILINGHDIRSLTQKSLHAYIGVVSQDTMLFNNTLYYNIAYGNFAATKQEIDLAISRAQLDSYIAQLPEGLETRVGERGLLLSGGEKQRIALARALLKKPKVYIFDEATSALDMTTERKIIKSLYEFDQAATKIIIAHRLTAIVDADEILVMNNGKIVERGSHQFLFDLNGVYSLLWDEQSGRRKRVSASSDYSPINILDF